MKKCPYCAEEIQDEAIKCKYCGEMLKEEQERIYKCIIRRRLPKALDNIINVLKLDSFLNQVIFLKLKPAEREDDIKPHFEKSGRVLRSFSRIKMDKGIILTCPRCGYKDNPNRFEDGYSDTTCCCLFFIMILPAILYYFFRRGKKVCPKCRNIF